MLLNILIKKRLQTLQKYI